MELEGSLPHSQMPAHLSLSSANSIQTIPTTSHFLKIHLNIILPSTPGSPKRSFSPQVFPPPKTVNTPLFSPIRASYPAHLILDFITRKILGENRWLSSSLCSFHQVFTCIFISGRDIAISHISPETPSGYQELYCLLNPSVTKPVMDVLL